MKQIVTALLLLSCTTSCGTIIHGRYQKFDVTSNVRDADVYVNSLHVGKTPLNFRLRRDSVAKNFDIKLTKDGYNDQTIHLKRKIDGLYWLNLLLGPGLIIDAVNGSIYRITPNKISLNLQKR